MMLPARARENITVSPRSGALTWSDVSKVNNGHEPMLARGAGSVLLKRPL